eukprot:XP_001696761.1 predicted protein [Chlamydomonas reinhardtii]
MATLKRYAGQLSSRKLPALSHRLLATTNECLQRLSSTVPSVCRIPPDLQAYCTCMTEPLIPGMLSMHERRRLQCAGSSFRPWVGDP